MSHIISAVYENGVFRPIEPPVPPLREGQEVRVMFEANAAPASVLALAARVYEGLSQQDVEDVERLALDRSKFFTRDTQ